MKDGAYQPPTQTALSQIAYAEWLREVLFKTYLPSKQLREKYQHERTNYRNRNPNPRY